MTLNLFCKVCFKKHKGKQMTTKVLYSHKYRINIEVDTGHVKYERWSSYFQIHVMEWTVVMAHAHWMATTNQFAHVMMDPFLSRKCAWKVGILSACIDTWSRPIWDLHIFYVLRQNLFTKLVVTFPDYALRTSLRTFSISLN